MASLHASPFRSTFTASNPRFPFSNPRTRPCLSLARRVWTRAPNSMSQPGGPGSLPSQDDDNARAENLDVLVQYVVLRRDLIDTWPLGSVVTQGCHASVFAIWSHKDDPHTAEYCSPQNIDSMHKVKTLPFISSVLNSFSVINFLPFLIYVIYRRVSESSLKDRLKGVSGEEHNFTCFQFSLVEHIHINAFHYSLLVIH